MPKPLIYIVRAELDADFVEPHHEWYARKHAPDVLGVGFLSARGYDATTAPHMWNIYEVPNLDIFSLDIYNNMHKNDPFVALAIPKLQGRTVSVFTQVIIAGSGEIQRDEPSDVLRSRDGNRGASNIGGRARACDTNWI